MRSTLALAIDGLDGVHVEHAYRESFVGEEVSAASGAGATSRPFAMIVRSVPSRSVFALPIVKGALSV